MALTWPNKDPEEVLDYPLDVSDWVVQGQNIDTASVVLESQVGDDTANPIVIEATQFGSNIINTWLSGGVDGVSYIFKVTFEDDQVAPIDRVGVRRVKIKVKTK